MRILTNLFLLTLVVVFFSCSNNAHEETAPTAEANASAPLTREQQLSALSQIEEEVEKAVKINDSIGKALVKAYSDYANNFPTDSLAADFLFKAAEVSTAIGEYQNALSYYETITTKYIDYRYVVESLFLQGHIYDDFLNQDDKAKAIYERLIAMYPKHKFAEDCKILIKNLGKTDEEIIKAFDKKNKEKPSANRQGRLMFPSFIVADNTLVS